MAAQEQDNTCHYQYIRKTTTTTMRRRTSFRRSGASFSSFLTFCGELSKATGYVAVCVPLTHTHILILVYVRVCACARLCLCVCVWERKKENKNGGRQEVSSFAVIASGGRRHCKRAFSGWLPACPVLLLVVAQLAARCRPISVHSPSSSSSQGMKCNIL